MNIFEHESYKEYFNDWVQAQPSGGHGEYRRLSSALGISSTMVSQIFKGPKHLALEHAVELSEYIGLTDLETEYLLLLVEYDKAGSIKLEQRLLKQLKKRQKEAAKVENLLKKDTELSDETKSVFYSSWIYSAVRILSDLPEFNDASTISKHLNLPIDQVNNALEFLLNHGLVKRNEGRLEIGPAVTHLPKGSFLVPKHHQNWRLLGFNKMVYQSDEDFFFTSPLSTTKEVAEKVRQRLPQIIKEIAEEVAPSESEVVRCLNIDWFEY